MRALGTIVDWSSDEPFGRTEFYAAVLDYYDWWGQIDPRIAQHHNALSPPAFAFGHDLVNMATYANEVLSWLPAHRMQQGQSVVIVGAMAEAFLFSVRSACDAVAAILAYAACDKPGQAPGSSLRRLIEWSGKNRTRVSPQVAAVLESDLGWFWKARQLRDDVAHGFTDLGGFCDTRQFDLMIMDTRKKQKASRTPLLPFLADHLENLRRFADQAAAAVNEVIAFPSERRRSRAVCGILVPALHRLLEIAPKYAKDPYSQR
jgi:hypothetical protein